MTSGHRGYVTDKATKTITKMGHGGSYQGYHASDQGTSEMIRASKAVTLGSKPITKETAKVMAMSFKEIGIARLMTIGYQSSGQGDLGSDFWPRWYM